MNRYVTGMLTGAWVVAGSSFFSQSDPVFGAIGVSITCIIFVAFSWAAP